MGSSEWVWTTPSGNLSNSSRRMDPGEFIWSSLSDYIWFQCSSLPVIEASEALGLDNLLLRCAGRTWTDSTDQDRRGTDVKQLRKNATPLNKYNACPQWILSYQIRCKIKAVMSSGLRLKFQELGFEVKRNGRDFILSSRLEGLHLSTE